MTRLRETMRKGGALYGGRSARAWAVLGERMILTGFQSEL